MYPNYLFSKGTQIILNETNDIETTSIYLMDKDRY